MDEIKSMCETIAYGRCELNYGVLECLADLINKVLSQRGLGSRRGGDGDDVQIRKEVNSGEILGEITWLASENSSQTSSSLDVQSSPQSEAPFLMEDSLDDQIECIGWYRYEIDITDDDPKLIENVINLLNDFKEKQLRVSPEAKAYLSIRTKSSIDSLWNTISWKVAGSQKSYPVHARPKFYHCSFCKGIFSLSHFCTKRNAIVYPTIF